MDGLTLQVPLASLGSLRKEMFTWSVLGMRRELIASMLKTLPKQVRARLLPIQASAPIITEFLAQVNNEEKRALSTCLAEFLTQHLRPQFVVREDDFVQSELPPHTLPGFQVLDANGKELAYGRDLAQLQFQFKEAAQTAFQAQGKSKKNTAASQNDTPMKTWAIGQLPQSIPIKLPTGTVYSYPCLRDTGEAVVYQVLDTEADAAQTHRQGVLRLLRLELKAQLTQIEKGPSNFQQIALQLKSVQNPQSLLNDFLDSVFERAALAEDALPYDEKAFKNTVQRCKARLAAVYQAACTILTDIAARTHALNQALYSASGAHGPVIPALKKWRDELVYDGFLRQTPWSHWQHLPRYIEAVQHRMNKFRDYPHREVQHAPVLRQWKERLDEQYMQYAYEPAKQMHWKQMRWHIEELHVSLFAQELKTAYPISNKRLEKIWAEHAAVR
jgi:ATP-dependent helicase HrpA